MKIVVRVSDGLGNQLFEYALGKYVSGILGCDMVFDRSHFALSENRTFLLDRFSGPARIRRWGILREYLFLVLWAFRAKIGESRFRAVLSRLGMTWIKIEDPFALQHDFDVESIRAWRGTMYISGCYGHVPHMPSRDALKELLTIAEPPSAANRRYIDDMRSSESVSVHVRRTDYLLACNNAPVLDVSYQRKAMDVMRRKVGNPRWFIFSDDIEWCRKEFADVENAVCVWQRVLSVGGHSPYVRLQASYHSQQHFFVVGRVSWRRKRHYAISLALVQGCRVADVRCARRLGGGFHSQLR